MRRQPATEKAKALDSDPEPEPEPIEPVRVDVRLLRPRVPRRRRVGYTRAGDRSTMERDFAEVRMFRRIGGMVLFGLLILFAFSQYHPG